MRIRKPGRRILLLLALGVGAYWSAAALRWFLPPGLEITHEPVVQAGELFELGIRASKQVAFEVEYGSTLTRLPSEAIDWTLFLPALPATVDLTVTASDARGNLVSESVPVTGLRPAVISDSVPASLVEGDPLAVFIAIEDPDATIADLRVDLNGVPAALHAVAGGTAVFGAVPLGSGAGEIVIDIASTDVFGRDRLRQLRVPVRTSDIPVDVLQLADEVLDLMTDSNRAAEAEMFELAYAEPIERPVWTEPFVLPSQGVGTSGFGDPRQYFPGGPVSFHEGADIAAPAGTPVVATNRGEVVAAGFYPLKGGFVMIDHGGLVTSHYAHLQDIHVVPGQVVARGELLGDMGTTGISTGPHLHWEMRVDGVASHPLPWVDRLVPGIDISGP